MTLQNDVLRIIEGGLAGNLSEVVQGAMSCADDYEAAGDATSAAAVRALVATREHVVGQVEREDYRAGNALLSVETVASDDVNLVLADYLLDEIGFVIALYQKRDLLASKGISARNTLLLYGPVGCGKTSIARYVAAHTGLPLAAVRLDVLVSQRLGEMGKAIRDVFDYAGRHECVLLLDEFDALARRRDDEHDSGELRRVTNIFLQQLDRFEGPGILVAATDRPDLLDAAVWSRFERVLKIPMPTTVEIKEYVNRFVQPSMTVTMRSKSYDAFEGMSYAELETATRNARRYVALVEDGGGLRPYHLLREAYELKNHGVDDEEAYVRYLIEAGCTLREINDRTSISMRKIQRVSSASRDDA